MPSFVYCPETDSMLPREEHYFNKYMRVADKQMMVGNKRVQIYYNPDEMAPTRHMVNNRMYTSKKKFRDETRARGCIEVGNETKITSRKRINPDRKQRREDIKKAIYDLKNGRNVNNM